MFTFENKYPETWQVLENFLRYAMKNIWKFEADGKNPKTLISDVGGGFDDMILKRDEFRAKVFDSY